MIFRSIVGLLFLAESIRRVEKIVGKKIASYSVDLLDKAALEEVFKKVGALPASASLSGWLTVSVSLR